MKSAIVQLMVCIGLVGQAMGSETESKGLRSGHKHLKHYAKIAAKKDIRGSKKEITEKVKVAGLILGTNAVGFGVLAPTAGALGIVLAGTALMSAPLASILIADAYGTSPAWTAQLQLLAQNKASISNKKVLYMGVPVDKINEELESKINQYSRFYKMWHYKELRKAYLLSSTFDDIKFANEGSFYYLFLNPNDANLVNVFLALNNTFERNLNYYIDKIAFLAIRPTPGITKAPSNGKNMPRIIIGFGPSAKDEAVEEVMSMLDSLTINGKKISEISLNVQPRYSQKINPWLYAAYGSADYKDSDEGKKLFADKAKGLWFWQSPSDEDMAYIDRYARLNENYKVRTNWKNAIKDYNEQIQDSQQNEPIVKKKPEFKYKYAGEKKEIPTIKTEAKVELSTE